jgi:WD40 repeat protein
MPNLTPVENWLGCPTLPNRTSLVASASYSEPKIFHFLVLVRNAKPGITSDGRRAMSGSDDETLRMWDLETGQALRIFKAMKRSLIPV